MLYETKDIQNLDRISRLKLINSICGIRGVHLIGTISPNKICNLAIFSSVVHIGSNPPLLGFVTRPNSEVKRDTYNNILETSYYTINSIEKNMVDRAHQTSGKYDSIISEFDACNIDSNFLNDFPAPFVTESKIKLGLKFVEKLDIKKNNTRLILGKIQLIEIPYSFDKLSNDDFIGVLGLNTYYEAKKIKDLEYVRIHPKI